ncbi:ABC transporter ATP-binding protein [Oceanispirochaeta sp.]|jgi:oligopeptide transport system ATP-binding protein|uniref:ABC transporter ATP-binding protein n=1 Tax=Oceanispirochaeta sp. TaxID=2035350 RepID=UPI0026151E74|nr:ABC transporter ATP-binding protein [Oceanispirochaeta sp.]MDA3955453.1 ABC transporter ATP-binding protein [Oceanispirochaeta sp.]
MEDILLEVKNIKTSFFTHHGEIQAVRGTSFKLRKGGVLGIVGESGSGKSVTALSIMGLIDEPGRIKEGEILFDGRDLAKLSQRELSDIRGNEIAMIFQDPMTSLNPVYTIKNQMVEVIRRHKKISRSKAQEEAVEMLRLVGIPEPESRINSFPHEFSGGMRQRVMIATALSCNPMLLIADEPTTALDVTIQAQILELMNDLKDKINASIILITHDLGVIAEVCDHIVVMYGGTIMEQGTEDDIFYNPQNPYTVGLHKSVPKITQGEKERLIPIEGSPPDLLHPPEGCPFTSRCPHTMEVCLTERPPSFALSESHSSACWLLHEKAPQVAKYEKAGAVSE